MGPSAAWFYEGQLRLHRNWNWKSAGVCVCVCACKQASYLAFLVLLSYFVLTELQPFSRLSAITVCEWILVVWFISHIVEELIQVLTLAGLLTILSKMHCHT